MSTEPPGVTPSPPVPADPPRGRRALVVENDPTDDARRLGDWLVEGGLDLVVLRPYDGAELPADLDGYAALVVLGGEQDAFAAADGTPGAPWFPALERLLRKAVRHRVPTLAVCLGAQLLAIARAAARWSAARPARRSARGWWPAATGPIDDPLFAEVPFAPDVLQWHRDEITGCRPARCCWPPRRTTRTRRSGSGRPPGACSSTSSATPRCSPTGRRTASRTILDLGLDPVALLESVDAVMPDVEEVWRPFAHRFAGVALGTVATAGAGPRHLPLLGA